MNRLRFVIVLLAVVACRENVTAPGACPEYCPTARLQVLDTVLSSVFAEDQWIGGYVQPSRALILQVANKADREQSRAVVRFRPFVNSFAVDDEFVPAAQTDSFRLRVPIRRWRDGLDDLEIRVHRIPATIDTATTYDELTPYFADSTLVTSFAIPDSVPSAGVTVTLPSDAFPTLEGDSLTTAVGIAVTSADSAWIDISSREGSPTGLLMTWHVQVDSVGTLVGRQEGQNSLFDSFLVDSVPPVPDDELVIGGSPSARTFLRYALPESILEFSTISQATLLLVPSQPMTGATEDTVAVSAFAVLGDFGPKSRPEPFDADSLGRGSVDVVVGQTDTVAIDVTLIVKAWQADSALPPTMVLLMAPEGGGLAELRVHSTRSAALKPAIRITYLPFFTFEEPLE